MKYAQITHNCNILKKMVHILIKVITIKMTWMLIHSFFNLKFYDCFADSVNYFDIFKVYSSVKQDEYIIVYE